MKKATTYFFFQYFRESSRKSKSKACILEELRVSFRMFKYKNEIEANEDAEMSVKQVQSAEYKKKKLKPFHSRSYGITKKTSSNSLWPQIIGVCFCSKSARKALKYREWFYFILTSFLLVYLRPIIHSCRNQLINSKKNQLTGFSISETLVFL